MQNRSKNRYIYFISLVITSIILFNITSFKFPDQESRLLLIQYNQKIKKTKIDTEILQMIDKIKSTSGLKPLDEKVLPAIKGNTMTSAAIEDDDLSTTTKEDENINSGEPATMQSRPFPNIPFNLKNIKDLDFRIYSHNVKNGAHEYLVEGELKWADRYKAVASSISFNAMPNTIVTLQEVYEFQLDDILKELNRYSDPKDPEWKAYGVGRIDAKRTGEFVPILYRPLEWDLVFNDTIWLNENNQRIANEGWDALYLRIASYVTLQHRANGNYINVFNTHLDPVGKISRLQSIRLLTRRMEDINKWPSFLCGDLNFEKSEEPYMAISEYYTDLELLATDVSYGHTKSTVTGFEGEVLLQGGQNIDYIFCPEYTMKIDQKGCEANGKMVNPVLKLKRRGMLHSKFNGKYMSDHRPLVADFILRGSC